ncbi:hypothetical protein [Actinomyces minihominis]|uniref:hypothetical protein n=1 Tax=Actinomyces minihominis TaxID=2002838 RepID=UPI000C06B68E|nr:hypothetical protein [Actinomyces minihominis]
MPKGEAVIPTAPFDVEETEELEEDEVVLPLSELSSLWRSELATAARVDATEAAARAVALSSAHPGGLAALYADAPTRLSNLVREETSLAEVTAKVGELRAFAEQLAAEHGHVVVHLAVGRASWGGPRPATKIPVFMRQVVIGEDEDGELTLHLLPGVEVSARLLREASLAGVEVDRGLLLEALHGPGGFAPAAALEAIAEVGTYLEKFKLRDDLSLEILTHPTASLFRDLSDTAFLERSEVLRGITGDSEAREKLERTDTEIVPNPADRDPWKEVGVGDQSPAVQDVIEAVISGGSYVVKPADGADLIGAAVSSAAALAAEGRSVLVVANDSASYEALGSRFEREQIGSIVADFFPGTDPERVSERLATALSALDPSGNEAEIENMRVALRRARAALGAYEEQLHAEFEDFGVTPFDALQVLTELTSDPDGPSTRVRLGAATLANLSEDGGIRARELLDEASRQGIFNAEEPLSGWDGIKLRDVADVQRVLDATEALAKEILPAVRVQMARVAGQTGLKTATTLDGWRLQLELIERAQSLLDLFRPEAFERSPADLVIATATPEWRKQKGINLKGSRRRQMVKQAKDLVRPGVHVADLHDALGQVQECRHQWRLAAAEEEPWPTIPEGLKGCVQTLDEATSQVRVIAPFLEPAFGHLGSMPLDELCPIIEALSEDTNGARLVPQRLRVTEELDALGLGELVEDFRTRQIEGELLGLELDLSWWASALGLMLAAEPRLGGFDPDLLQGLVGEIRVLDQAQVESLGHSVVERVKSGRRDAVSVYPEQHAELIAALGDEVPARTLFGEYSLAWDLLPIVCAGPALVPAVANRRRPVDTVLLVGMADAALAELAPIIARGSDVIAFASAAEDVKSGSWLSKMAKFLPVYELPARPATINGHFADLVVKYKPDTSIVAVPAPRPLSTIEYIKVEGSGMPAPTTVAIESSLGEADRAAEYLLDHMARNTGQTINIVTFSERHADRVRASIRRLMGLDRNLSSRLGMPAQLEKMVVLPEQLAANRPERTVLSVGFAKTAHGRVIHDFGVLSTPEGIEAIEQIAQGSVGDLTVVTSLESTEIDRSRLRHAGALALVDLLALAEGRTESDVTGDGGEHVPDDLLVDLADRLHRLGLPIVANLGVGPTRIPLAVGHPEVPGELLVAVLTDDPNYRGEPSLRVRDRYWPEQLENAGWKVRTELSMSVFIDPNKEAQHIVELVLDAVDEYYIRIGKPVTPAAAATLAAEGAELLGETKVDSAESNGLDENDEAIEVESDSPIEVTVEAAEDPEDDEPGQPIAIFDEVDEVAEVEGAPAPDEGVEGDLSEVLEAADLLEKTAVEVDDADLVRVQLEDAVPEVEEVIEVVEVPEVEVGPRPPVTKGLPLAAYSDDQLDEVATWLWARHPGASEEDQVEALREAIGLRRRGAQSHTVLANVVRRTSGK